MFKFTIVKNTIWRNDKEETLKTFNTSDIKKGIEKCRKLAQQYINNGTVNDYTSFASGYLIANNKQYSVSTFDGKLTYLY